MQLEKNLWLEGGYYIDIDEKGQFRIIGPNNHLYCGLIDIPPHRIHISTIHSKSNAEVCIEGSFIDNLLNFYYPAMDDIRTVRLLAGKDTFLEARKRFADRLVPQQIKKFKKDKKTYLEFSRLYGDKYYKITVILPQHITVQKINYPLGGFKLRSQTKRIPFKILAKTNDIESQCPCPEKDFFISQTHDMDFRIFGKKAGIIKYFWERTSAEIIHLIGWGKTSGDRFGTIFPRDWMESADIGVHDLSPQIRSYMYFASLKNVNAQGEGWHEDVVGEFKYEYRLSGKDIFDRHMIDIEPHYIMALEKLPEDFLLNVDVRKKIQRVAKYILQKARKEEFITFKKLSKSQRSAGRKFHPSGNWRDSEWAFKKVSEVIAPFDVNAVFYPTALGVLKKFQKKLRIHADDINDLIEKWKRKKDNYLFKNKDGSTAYALALYNIKKQKNNRVFQKLKVDNLDESYLYTYSSGSQKEIVSFCKRLLDATYFYTDYGPLIIANNNNMGYTNQEYHGLVVWIKQVAFCILGLSKHLKVAITEGWPTETQTLIKSAMLQTCENIIHACIKLNAVPELFYMDGKEPKFFPISSSKVQLWSAISIRRIIRKYIELKTNPIYTKIH